LRAQCARLEQSRIGIEEALRILQQVAMTEGEAGESLLDRLTAGRSMTLWHADIGSDAALARAVREGYGKAWQARDRWPRELQRRYREFKIEEVARFLGAVQMASWRSRGLIHTYTTGYRSTA
jgi:hypothetical protein